jgi:hypothetical protein
MNAASRHLLFATINAIGLPGVGTLLAGRRVLGWTQAILALVLLCASFLGLLRLILLLHKRGLGYDSLPHILSLEVALIERPQEVHTLLLTMGFMGLYLLNLLWSVLTSRPAGPPPLKTACRSGNPSPDKSRD